MKDKFFGFYSPEEKEIDEIWKDSIISLDANTLLNLYRYSKSTTEDFLKVLKEFKDRLWLPYQAGFEFHSNRIGVIKAQENTYSDIGKELDEGLKQIENRLNKFKRHPFVKIETLLKELATKCEKLKNDLEKQYQKHPEYLKSDDILPEITEIFKEKVGDDYNESDLDKIYKEGELRYEKNVPPGFSDRENKKNKGNRHLYGDLIIWKQLINHSKKTKKTIIFITDDRKEDWWLKFKGETIQPREELIKEFFNETGLRILIYQADFFLKYVNDRKEAAIKDKSIEEIKSVRLEDESKYVSLYNLQSDYGITKNDMLRFDNSNGIYINPLSGSTMDYLNKSTSILSTMNEKPMWLDNLSHISQIAQKPIWMDTNTTISKLTQRPAWMDTLDSISKLTQRPAWLDTLDSISKLTQRPAWLDSVESFKSLNNPIYTGRTNTDSKPNNESENKNDEK